MDHMEVERHHAHDRRIRYPEHDMRNHGADADMRSKFLHLQQRYKVRFKLILQIFWAMVWYGPAVYQRYMYIVQQISISSNRCMPVIAQSLLVLLLFTKCYCWSSNATPCVTIDTLCVTIASLRVYSPSKKKYRTRLSRLLKKETNIRANWSNPVT